MMLKGQTDRGTQSVPRLAPRWVVRHSTRRMGAHERIDPDPDYQVGIDASLSAPTVLGFKIRG